MFQDETLPQAIGESKIKKPDAKNKSNVVKWNPSANPQQYCQQCQMYCQRLHQHYQQHRSRGGGGGGNNRQKFFILFYLKLKFILK